MSILKTITCVCIIVYILLGFGDTLLASSPPPYKVAIVFSQNIQDNRGRFDVKYRKDLIKFIRPNVTFQSYYIDYNSHMPEARIQENAEKIYNKIYKYSPDVVLTYGDVAFEQVAIRYLYPHQIKTIFFNIWKENYDVWSQQYHLAQYIDKIAGVVVVGNSAKITSIMDGLDLNYLYIVQNDQRYVSSFGRSLYSNIKNRKIETFNVASLGSLERTVNDLNHKPKGLLLIVVTDVLDYNGDVASSAQIANTITSANKTHYEMSYSKNYARYSMASSLVLNDITNRENLSRNNRIITDMIIRSKANVSTTTNEMIINVDRTKALKFDRLLLSYPPLFDGISDDL